MSLCFLRHLIFYYLRQKRSFGAVPFSVGPVHTVDDFQNFMFIMNRVLYFIAGAWIQCHIEDQTDSNGFMIDMFSNWHSIFFENDILTELCRFCAFWRILTILLLGNVRYYFKQKSGYVLLAAYNWRSIENTNIPYFVIEFR